MTSRRGPGAHIKLADEVSVTITRDGMLELLDTGTGRRYRWHQVATAMWLALQQHGGRPDLAAAELAGHWEIDPTWMRADLDVWLGELQDVGLVRYEW
jgi:hypothetical protein